MLNLGRKVLNILGVLLLIVSLTMNETYHLLTGIGMAVICFIIAAKIRDADKKDWF